MSAKHAIEFDEKDRSAKITYGDLAETMELGNGFGELPKSCPRQPGELIMDIVDAAKKFAGIDATVAPIIIREPYCQVDRKRMKEGGVLKLGDYAIKRLVARVDLPLEAYEGTKDHMNASIAMTYIHTDSSKGIQVGFGENVKVCENRTIFGGFKFGTYGSDKVPFEKGMELLHHWLQNIQTVHDKHIAVIDRLMETKVKRIGFQRLIGSLFEKAVRYNSGEKGMHAPLNQTQIGQMVVQGLDVLKDESQEALNGWEILNWGTNVLKAENSDMQTLLTDTSGYNDFLLREFKIEPDFAI